MGAAYSGAIIVGATASVGIAINTADLKDSGIILNAGLGTGWYAGIDTPLNTAAQALAEGVVEGIIQTNRPHSTTEMEGIETRFYGGAGIGITGIINEGGTEITGVDVLSVGGAVMREGTLVITVEEVVESFINFLLLPIPGVYFDW